MPFSLYADVCVKDRDIPSSFFSSLSLSLPLHVQCLLLTLLLQFPLLAITSSSSYITGFPQNQHTHVM